MSLVDLAEYLAWWLKGVHHDGLPRAETIGSVAGARGFRDGEQAFRSAEAAERSRLGLRPPEQVTPLGVGGSGVVGSTTFGAGSVGGGGGGKLQPQSSPDEIEALLAAVRPRDVAPLPGGELLRDIMPRGPWDHRQTAEPHYPQDGTIEVQPPVWDGSHPPPAPAPVTAGAGLTTPTEAERFSLQMLLWCPECGERHVDLGVWATRRHHTHACQHCGHTWRPAVIDTFGVQFLPGFKNEPEGGAA